MPADVPDGLPLHDLLVRRRTDPLLLREVIPLVSSPTTKDTAHRMLDWKIPQTIGLFATHKFALRFVMGASTVLFVILAIRGPR